MHPFSNAELSLEQAAEFLAFRVTHAEKRAVGPAVPPTADTAAAGAGLSPAVLGLLAGGGLGAGAGLASALSDRQKRKRWLRHALLGGALGAGVGGGLGYALSQADSALDKADSQKAKEDLLKLREELAAAKSPPPRPDPVQQFGTAIKNWWSPEGSRRRTSPTSPSPQQVALNTAADAAGEAENSPLRQMPVPQKSWTDHLTPSVAVGIGGGAAAGAARAVDPKRVGLRQALDTPLDAYIKQFPGDAGTLLRISKTQYLPADKQTWRELQRRIAGRGRVRKMLGGAARGAAIGGGLIGGVQGSTDYLGKRLGDSWTAVAEAPAPASFTPPSMSPPQFPAYTSTPTANFTPPTQVPSYTTPPTKTTTTAPTIGPLILPGF